MINHIVFRDVAPQALLSALDKVFISEPIQNDGPRVPRWLADFLVRLSQVRTYDTVLDIYSPRDTQRDTSKQAAKERRPL